MGARRIGQGQPRAAVHERAAADTYATASTNPWAMIWAAAGRRAPASARPPVHARAHARALRRGGGVFSTWTVLFPPLRPLKTSAPSTRSPAIAGGDKEQAQAGGRRKGPKSEENNYDDLPIRQRRRRRPVQWWRGGSGAGAVPGRRPAPHLASSTFCVFSSLRILIV